MSTDQGMDKEDVIHTYKEYYSVIKKNEMQVAATLDGPRDYYSKWSKSYSERQIWYHSYMESNF